MSGMSIPQLMKAYNGIPRREEFAIALASTRSVQRHGHIEYDVIQAGQALIDYYHRMERSTLARHQNRKKADSTFFLKVAEKFRKRAKAIEDRLKELRTDEDHQTSV